MGTARVASFAVVLVALGACSTENDGGGTGGGATASGSGGNGGSSTATSASSSSGVGEGGAGGDDGAGGDGGAAVAVPSPEECEAFTDEASCIAGGCSLFENLRELRVDEEGICRYGAELYLCIGWEHVGVAVGGGTITGWYRMKDGVRQDIEGNAVYIGGLPGWNGCDAEEPSDGACACAGLVQE